jgi:hypothetical protein
MIMETNTEKLIEALQLLSESVDSIDGIANAVIFEAAQRLNELQTALQSAHGSLILARNERDEARGEVDAIRKVISNAGFSEVLDPLERVTRLIRERDEAIAERTPHDYGLLKHTIEGLKQELHESREELAKVKRECVKTVTVSFPGMPTSSGGGGGGACGNDHLPDATKMIHPEPSRLEIAALLLANDRAYEGPTMALKRADALIAAAKEVK